jgi:hypothetical protein
MAYAVDASRKNLPKRNPHGSRQNRQRRQGGARGHEESRKSGALESVRVFREFPDQARTLEDAETPARFLDSPLSLINDPAFHG